MDILQEIYNIGIIPVVKINDAKKAVPLAKALIDGGINAAEVTFRTDAAEEAIRSICTAFPDMIVGAGTVLTIEQAERAKNAGAKFIVSPGFNPRVVKWCLDNNIQPLPGCTTPSEIEQAMELGLDVLKFFPAEQSGGLAKIKALAAPYTKVKFMPTGGVSLKNLAEYLSFGKIVACGGSFMVKDEYIDNDKWDVITEQSIESVNTVLNLRLEHIGINSENEEEARKAAKLFELICGKKIEKDGEKSIFVGSEYEFMKFNGRGKNGHLAIATANVERAIYYLEKRGVEFDYDTIVRDEKSGKAKFIYLKDEIAGFAVHLILK